MYICCCLKREFTWLEKGVRGREGGVKEINEFSCLLILLRVNCLASGGAHLSPIVVLATVGATNVCL